MCRLFVLFEFFVFLNYKSQRNFVWFQLLFSSFGSHALLTAIILLLFHILVRLIDFLISLLILRVSSCDVV